MKEWGRTAEQLSKVETGNLSTKEDSELRQVKTIRGLAKGMEAQVRR